MAPLRLKNLCALDVERHLLRPSRDSETLHIVFDASEVKNSEPLEFPLPRSSVELIERYLTQFRPALASAGNSALFPGRRTGCKDNTTLCKQIIRAVFAHTGMHVHPRLF